MSGIEIIIKMHANLYVYGPVFNNGFKHYAINIIDIYSLICKILEITPEEVDEKIENTT